MPLELDIQQANELLETGKAVFLDVREAIELQVCRIGDPIHMPMGEIPLNWNTLPRDKPLIVYCHHGRRSMMATLFLRQHGFNNACSLSGGIDAWALKIDPSLVRY